MRFRTFGETYYTHSLITTGILLFIYIFGFTNLSSSILNYQSTPSEMFDGSVYPIEYIPDPMKLSYTERKQKFEDIDSKYFIKLPLYNPSVFWADIDSLPKNSLDYVNTLVQRVTYTVPYLGSYNFDYQEYEGSHPGVDIIAPLGTPVRAIANGLVVDTGYQPSWFWNYILLKHSAVDYNGKTQTIYSLYGHLSKIQTTQWENIKKWSTIWLVGETGTATTPHLHFQIDVQEAPFSPYWPFSTADMKSAWVWFFEAINIGLGKESAIKYTINPLKFVNDTLNYILYTNTPEIPPEEITQKDETQVTSPNPSWEITVIDDDDDTLDLPLNNEQDTSSHQVQKEDLLDYDVDLLSALDVENLITTDYSWILSMDEDSANHQDIPTKTLLPEDTTPSIPSSHTDVSERIFTDITEDYKYLKEVKYFKENNIIMWFEDGSFRPKNNITRVEALKIILLSNQVTPIENESSRFQDISTQSWENTYINAWIRLGIVSLDNAKFSPFRNVSRVEALKLILTLTWVDLKDIAPQELSDVDSNAWYAPYVYYALEHNLIWIENGKFYPDMPLTREELISILYKYKK